MKIFSFRYRVWKHGNFAQQCQHCIVLVVSNVGFVSVSIISFSKTTGWSSYFHIFFGNLLKFNMMIRLLSVEVREMKIKKKEKKKLQITNTILLFFFKYIFW